MTFESDKRVIMAEAHTTELLPIDQVPGFEGIEGGEGVYAALLGDPKSGPWFYVFRHDPDVEIPRHTHSSNTMHYIIEGEWHMGRRVFEAGFFQYEMQGQYYGPFKSGPQGSKFLAIYGDRPGFITKNDDGTEQDITNRPD
jgi:hypothetical protein